MKTEVYSWRLSAVKKAELEAESRREGTSLSKLLDDITAEWLSARRDGADEAEQVAIRKRAEPAIGCIRGGDPTRSARAAELVRETIARKHARESNAGRRSD